MKYKITSDINRIELHDSSIISSESSDNSIILKFDWVAISDYREENLTALVLGNCELRLNGIRENFLERVIGKDKSKIDFPGNFPKDFDEVLENLSDNDNELRLSGFMTIGSDYPWINWQIKFESFEFLWDVHVTRDDWKRGILPR